MIIYPPNILVKDTGKPAQPSPAQPMAVLLQHAGGSPGPQQHPARFHPPVLWPGTPPGISALPEAQAHGLGSDNRKRFFLKTTAAATAPPPHPQPAGAETPPAPRPPTTTKRREGSPGERQRPSGTFLPHSPSIAVAARPGTARLGSARPDGGARQPPL